MPQIGTLFRRADGSLHGSLKTLTLEIELVLRPCAKEHERSPDYRVLSGSLEFGAAWKRTSHADREYLSVKLDDPCFPAPIYASIIEMEDGEQRIIWTR
jgi:uncharacterized protein (DUF736 family)